MLLRIKGASSEALEVANNICIQLTEEKCFEQLGFWVKKFVAVGTAQRILEYLLAKGERS